MILFLVIYDVFFDLSGIDIGIEVSIDVEEYDEVICIDGFYLICIKFMILEVFKNIGFKNFLYFEVVSSSGSSVIMVFGLNIL